MLIEKDNVMVGVEIKEEKKIKKVLHRLMSEETTKLRKIAKRIDVLSHQAENFYAMYPEIQNDVKDEMFNLMKENGWDDWIKELKEELKELEKERRDEP